MSRNVVLYELMSLDGCADDPGEGDWFGDADERLIDFLGEVIATQDAVLLGRRTYEKWAPHWPTSTMQPFADFINSTQKYLFSATPSTVAWAEHRARGGRGTAISSPTSSEHPAATSASTAA